MLSPKRVKWRKQFRGNFKGMSKGATYLSFGDFGLKATTAGRITARQIEASRIAIARSVKRGGKIWVRIFPDRPITQKPAETRMGSGKGNPEYWVMNIKPGRILFEMTGVTRVQAEEAFRLASYKLPFQTRFISRD